MTTLHSSKAKLRRAKSHFTAVANSIKLVQRANIKHVTSRLDPETGEKLFLYRGTPRPLPSIGLKIGDAIHNWRSALDHLAWSLVEINGGTPTRRTAFPIFNNRDLYERYFRTRTEGMSSQAKAMVDRFQPLHRRYPNGHWLVLLDQLDNIDKHRHIYVTLTATNGGSYTGVRLREIILTDWVANYGPIENGTILARIPNGYEHVDFIPAFGIGIGGGLPGQDQPLNSILRAFELTTAGIVADFDRKFF